MKKICVMCPLSNAHFVDIHYLYQGTLGRIRQDPRTYLTRTTPRLKKEAFRGIVSFFAFTCFARHSRYLQTFVNELCVHYQLEARYMSVSYTSNTRPNPGRRLKILASSYSPAQEEGIPGLSFFLCFHVLCVPFPVLTNICEQDLCPMSIAHPIDVRVLCQITLGGIRQDE